MISICKLEFFKFIKNPWTLLFGIGFTIMWVLIDGFVWGNMYVTNSNITVINFIFPGLVILIATTFTINTISMTFFSDRVEKRIKQLSLTKITVKKYLSGLFMFNYIIFLCDFLIIFFIALFLFNLYLTFISFIWIIIISLIIFLTNFFIQ